MAYGWQRFNDASLKGVSGRARDEMTNGCALLEKERKIARTDLLQAMRAFCRHAQMHERREVSEKAAVRGKAVGPAGSTGSTGARNRVRSSNHKARTLGIPRPAAKRSFCIKKSLIGLIPSSYRTHNHSLFPALHILSLQLQSASTSSPHCSQLAHLMHTHPN